MKILDHDLGCIQRSHRPRSANYVGSQGPTEKLSCPQHWIRRPSITQQASTRFFSGTECYIGQIGTNFVHTSTISLAPSLALWAAHTSWAACLAATCWAACTLPGLLCSGSPGPRRSLAPGSSSSSPDEPTSAPSYVASIGGGSSYRTT